MKPAFFPLAVDADKSCVGGKDGFFIAAVNIVPKDINRVLDRGITFLGPFGLEPEKRTLADAFSELDFVHADGDKVAAGIVHTGRNPADFVNPLQEVAPEKVTIMIEMPR